MGSQLLQSNCTATPQPSMPHPTSVCNSRVSCKKWCNKNDLAHNYDNKLSPAFEPLHQTLHQEHTNPLEFKQEKIPPDILMDKTQCVDYINCLQQNGTQFGFIPLTPLKVYTGHHTSNKAIHNIVDLHTTIKASNLNSILPIGGSTWLIIGINN